MKHTSTPLLALAVLAATVTLACTDDSPDSDPTPAPTARPTRTPLPGVDDRVMLSGRLTLDGQPFDAEFLGARVVHENGLVGACQGDIPPVVRGEYRIPVVADAEVRGCGAEGAQVVLWAHVNGDFHFSNETVPWPGAGQTVEFDATFSTASPAGATKPVTEIKGLLFDRDGRMLPGGTVVEAYVGDTLCGRTPLRRADATEGYYTLIVAGPESIPACAEGASLTFRVDGTPTAETAINDLGKGPEEHEVNLTLR